MQPQPETRELPTHILVVDDAADTQLMIELRLKKEGYAVSVAGTGEEALDIVRLEGLPELVLLDIVMPGMDGFAVAQQLRQMGDIPIIFLSALTDTTTKVEALNRFAEDYVTKPFAFSELLARIRRVLLRSKVHKTADLEILFDDRLSVNFVQQYAMADRQRVALTPMENRLLHILYKHRKHVLSPEFLMEKAWDSIDSGSPGSLWVHIRRLRRKIEPDAKNPRYIITIRGQGYCLDVERLDDL